jgi:soluble lytic murein transglycosylase-like protein
MLTFLFSLLVVVTSVEELIEIPLPDNTYEYWEDGVSSFEVFLSFAYHDRAGEFAPWILEAAYLYEMDEYLLARLVFAESSFRKKVRSRSGAIGPAQIKPKYWAKFCGSYDLNVPRENILCAAQILAYLEDWLGDLRKAVKYYNAGTGIPTPGYVNKVLDV